MTIIPPASHTTSDDASPERHRDSYPDDDGEEGPAAGGQVDVGVQEVLVQVRVGQQGQFGQNGRHLQVHVIRLQDADGRWVKPNNQR